MKLAVVGIQGLPNKYGGFETLASKLVEGLSAVHDITVYCSAPDMVGNNKHGNKLRTQDLPTHYHNATLHYINCSSHGMAGMLYDTLALRHAFKNNDAVIFLGFGAGLYMPFVSSANAKKIILNFGGLDWKRNKWSPVAKFIIKLSERLLVKKSGTIIADNTLIQDYISDTYGREAALIAYGGDQAMPEAPTTNDTEQYPFVKSKYAFAVCRIQPDNNIVMQLEAFKNTSMPFVMVGNFKDSDFGMRTKEKYGKCSNLILLDAIYDTRTLNMLRSNCTLYIHGHSAGGTNPSLVEAMHLGLSICAYASGYNEATTHGLAQYFTSEASLREQINLVDTVHLNSKKMQDIAAQQYTWKAVVAAYEVLCNKVVKQ